MKKLVPLLLALALLLCACGSSGVPGQSSNTPSVSVQTAAPTPEPVVIYDAFCEMGSYTDNVGNTYDYVLRIPAIQAPGSDATRINQELFSTLYLYVNEAKDAMRDGLSLIVNRVDYTVHIKGELISIVAQVATDWGFDTYYVVNFDAGTKTQLDRASMLARFGMDEEEFLALAAGAVEAYFTQSFDNIPHDEFWLDRHDRSLATENFTSDCQLYVDDNGELNMIVKLYSFAGGDYYYHSFTLTASSTP